MRSKLLIFVLVASVPLFFSCQRIISNLPVQSVQDCDLRETTVPQFPVYPGSSLISDIEVLNNTSATILEYVYDPNASLDDVLRFYSTISICSYYPSRQQNICEGDAEEFGDFSVFISDDDTLTPVYSLQLSWNKCGVDWDELNSVEND